MGMFAGRKDIIGNKHVVEKKAISLLGWFGIDEHALKDEYRRRDSKGVNDIDAITSWTYGEYTMVENYLSNE